MLAPRLALSVAILACGCGSKTGLAVEAMDAGRDAGPDAFVPPDAGRDAGPDAPVCVPGVVALDPSEIEVVFVIDRSGSMASNFEGLPPAPGELSRWETLELAMADALEVFGTGGRTSLGAKFFPSRSRRGTDDPCAVFDGLDVNLSPGAARGIVSAFSAWNPAGGTPLAPALEEALEALEVHGDPDNAQFIVAMTDGAPTCTGSAAADALAAIRQAHDERGVDVFVVGIASTAPEVELLDVMAIQGGRARPAEEERRFYDARDPTLLSSLLNEITRDLALCVFAVPIPPRPEDVVEVLVDGALVARDEARADGWDWTSERRTQLSLFGDACARVIESGAEVRANITCR